MRGLWAESQKPESILMKSYISILAVTTPLLATAIASPHCHNGTCRPSDSWSGIGTAASSLNTPPSTLNPSPHCRIHVGDGSGGSGALVELNNGTGFVLTCSHLFDNATTNIVVAFPNGQRFAARLLERDPAHDLAAILIHKPNLKPLAVEAGEPIGILTACGYGASGQFRPVRGPITGAANIVGASFPSLKIRVTVRPGDSGGAVLNNAGRLVGIVWGCRDGETYCAFGPPLRKFLQRILGERASVRGPRPAALSPEPTSPSSPTLDPPAWHDDIETRLASLETNKQPRGDYLQPGDLNIYATKSDITTAMEKSQTAFQQINQHTDSRIESLRTTLKERIDQKLSTIAVTPRSGLSYPKLLAAVLGLSGPIALAIFFATRFAHQRLSNKAPPPADSQPSTFHARPYAPIAVDTPAPPQQTITESHYVPVQRDDFARAHQWAREQVARKYPGATEALTTLESLIKQQLAATPDP